MSNMGHRFLKLNFNDPDSLTAFKIYHTPIYTIGAQLDKLFDFTDFYIDQQNGNNNNSGNSDFPLKSISEALSRCPTSSFIRLFIIGEYFLNEDIFDDFPRIRLFNLDNGRIIFQSRILNNTYNGVYGFSFGGDTIFYTEIQPAYEVLLEVDNSNYDASKANHEVAQGALRGSKIGISHYSFYFNYTQDGNCIYVGDNNYSLISNYGNLYKDALNRLVIVTMKVFNTNTGIYIGNNSFFLRFNGCACINLPQAYFGGINNGAKSWKDCIDGIQYNELGIPYNIISNIKLDNFNYTSTVIRNVTTGSISGGSSVTLDKNSVFPDKQIDLYNTSINLYVLDQDSSSPTYNKWIVDNSIITIAVDSSSITLINNTDQPQSYRLICMG